MIGHLEAAANASQENPLNSVFQYLQELCSQHATLQNLSQITDNIQYFIAERGYAAKSEQSKASYDPAKLFSATAVESSNAAEIEAAFEEIDADKMASKVDRLKQTAEEKYEAGLAEAEQKLTEKIARMEADKKKAMDDRSRGLQNAGKALEQAKNTINENYKNELKQLEEDNKNTIAEYEDVKKAAIELLREAEKERSTLLKEAADEYQLDRAEIIAEFQEVKGLNEERFLQGRKKFEEAKARAAALLQTARKPYYTGSNKKFIAEDIRSKLNNILANSQTKYQGAINLAQKQLLQLQEAVEADMAEAGQEYNVALEQAEKDYHKAGAEANQVKENALEEYNKMLQQAESKLLKKRALVEQTKEKIGEQRYISLNKAEEDQKQALASVEDQYQKALELADKNLVRIQEEYHEDIDQVMVAYQDTWDKATGMLNKIQTKIPQSKAANKTKNKRKRVSARQ